MPPLVDILYFAGTMILVVFMAIFIVRSIRAKSDDDTTAGTK
jgi:hypothetical protein